MINIERMEPKKATATLQEFILEYPSLQHSSFSSYYDCKYFV